MGLVKEGGIKVEQVLKFFPDFVLIDQVKDDLVEALRRYNTELEELSKELDDSANNTEMIRNDIKAVKTK
jgi:vacuolar protein sorting-associated protein 18